MRGPGSPRVVCCRADRSHAMPLAPALPPQADASGSAFSADGRLWQGMPVVAAGANRVCVLDPDMPGHCLKYLQAPDPQRPRALRHRLRAWWQVHGPGRDANALEWQAWRWLHARQGDALDLRVARCLGIASTANGPALRCRLVPSNEGSGAAPSLYALLFGPARGRYDAPALCAAVARFEAWLQRHALPLFDLNSGNLVVVERDGLPELVCVDVKSVLGGKEPIPVSRWSRRLMRRKIARRAERLRQRILAHAPLAGTQPPH